MLASECLYRYRLSGVYRIRNLTKRINAIPFENLDSVCAELLPKRAAQIALDLAGIFHLGAITDTRCADEKAILEHNVNCSTRLWDWCTREKVPLIYASSAAVYGDAPIALPESAILLEPLNLYGRSKLVVDLRCEGSACHGFAPPHWYGLRFFNVYGPGEEHKGEMRSIVRKLYDQATAGNPMELFEGTEKAKRDFVHVDDCVDVMLWLMEHKPANGIYNVGTGKAESFSDVTGAVAGALGYDPSGRLIPMPYAIRASYQHFTQADISKLRAAGYDKPFRSIEDGIRDYVRALGP